MRSVKAVLVTRAVCLAALLLAACTSPAIGNNPGIGPTAPAGPLPRLATATPFQPQAATPTPSVLRVWLSPALPEALRAPIVSLSRQGNGRIDLVRDEGQAEIVAGPNAESPLATWIYAVVAPFPTVQDGLTIEELRAAWTGGRTLLTDENTAAAFQAFLGGSAGGSPTLAPSNAVLDRTWAARPALAVVPFEALDPRWKVLELGGVSPIRRDFDPAGYPLVVSFGLSGEPQAVAALQELLRAGEVAGTGWPSTNRDPDRLTVLVMTGVTALARATAWRMDVNGVDYPGELIGDWLREADLTHTSNEVSFAENCPQPDPASVSLRFCSAPGNMALLEDVGIDVIELTGNHVVDWGREAFLQTLDLYRLAGMEYFGGGADLAESLQPLLVEHNGNRLAFLGCNPAGPSFAWATETLPGAAPCDYERLYAEVARLRGEGYLPVFTFQWAEFYRSRPMSPQVAGFRAAIDAGALIVSGSQAHQPQGFEFYGAGFIHYGPGNLFFDQMWSIPTRQEFIDRYVIYDGRHISTELLTAFLEDWAQPRPMTPEERAAFLEAMFTASGW